ncbi:MULTISPECIES: hypothetical protein [Bifidobacterium]|nr:MULTISPECIES: hypothetical protein [Bifidobacterium]QOL32273.1 hypothetical protein BE0216_07255 [Bifidobacterium eulemuris]QOL35233.1 hypothetical protein BL8807_05120 [Bifidobacterium lemurum]
MVKQLAEQVLQHDRELLKRKETAIKEEAAALVELRTAAERLRAATKQLSDLGFSTRTMADTLGMSNQELRIARDTACALILPSGQPQTESDADKTNNPEIGENGGENAAASSTTPESDSGHEW